MRQRGAEPPRGKRGRRRLRGSAQRRGARRRPQFHQRDDLYSQPQFGDMFSNLTASYDPVFWPIHVNIDRTLVGMADSINPTGLPADLDAVLSPWSYTIRDTLDISRFGYEYVRGSCLMPVGMEAPVGRFVSKPIQIDANRCKNFRKAEVRLHWVPQLPALLLRARLPQPAGRRRRPRRCATIRTIAGYLAIFGHGECYGGPGHCDLPPPRARASSTCARAATTRRATTAST